MYDPNTKGQIIAKMPHSQGLYQVLIENEKQPSLHTNVATEKMSISEAHRKLGHISSAAIRHTVSKGYITGICLDEDSKPEFCDACAKAKSARQLSQKTEQQNTETTYTGTCGDQQQ